MTKPTLLQLLVVASVFAIALTPSLAPAAPGDLYVANGAAGEVVKFDPPGTRTAFTAGLQSPSGVAFDGKGNLFVADLVVGNSNIYKFSAGGTRTTFATGLSSPEGLAVDAAGNLYVADFLSGSVFKFTPAGAQSTFASGLASPTDVAFDATGNLYVVTNGDGTIVRITPGGTKTTFASGLGKPFGLAFDQTGNVFVGDTTSGNIIKITPAGAKTTFASATGYPRGLDFDSAGNLFVADANTNSILQFTPAGGKSTFVTGLNDPFFIAFEPALHQLLNISTRGMVGTGDGALIGGFIVGGNGAVGGTVIARAIGPSLEAAGVSGALHDPTLELHDAAGTKIAFNDDWSGGTQKAQIEATGVAPTNDLESALIATVPAGRYTAVVRGLNNGTGIALVEVYNLQ
jgi:sugar lactone lactonase YvrE